MDLGPLGARVLGAAASARLQGRSDPFALTLSIAEIFVGAAAPPAAGPEGRARPSGRTTAPRRAARDVLWAAPAASCHAGASLAGQRDPAFRSSPRAPRLGTDPGKPAAGRSRSARGGGLLATTPAFEARPAGDFTGVTCRRALATFEPPP